MGSPREMRVSARDENGDARVYRRLLRNIWAGMIRRCDNPNASGYANYGGRGITVCERWRASFEAFLDDMGPRPPGTSIDRINNDGPYAPDNCRWATQREQLLNTRFTRWVTWKGRAHRIADLADAYGIDLGVLTGRIDRGWPMERALQLDLAPVAPPPHAYPTWPLTARQLQVLVFVAEFIERERKAPSIREIARAINVRGTNSVSRHLMALERKGKLVCGRQGLDRQTRITTVGARLVAEYQGIEGG